MLLWLSAVLAAATALLVAATARGRVHPLAALLGVAAGYGLAAGMAVGYLLSSLGDGMAAAFGAPGLAIVAGSLLAVALERSGGGQALAALLLRLPQRLRGGVPPAVAACACGGVASVESAVLLLAPPLRHMMRAAGRPGQPALLTLALSLYAGHALLLPAPGPVIATAITDADSGLVLAFGALAAAAATLAAVAYARLIGRRLSPPPAGDDAGAAPAGTARVPAAGLGWRTAAVILVPLLLLLAGSLGHVPDEPLGGGAIRERLLALGGPAATLLTVAVLALALPAKLDRQVVGERGWLADAVARAAPLLLVVAAAGGLARVLQNSGLPDLAGEALAGSGPAGWLASAAGGWLGILLPFAAAAAIKTAQGSTQVAMIMAAGIVEPLLPQLGAADDVGRALAVVAIGAGALAVSHANDGLFWIVSHALGRTPAGGYRVWTPGTAATAAAALLALFAIKVVNT